MASVAMEGGPSAGSITAGGAGPSGISMSGPPGGAAIEGAEGGEGGIELEAGMTAVLPGLAELDEATARTAGVNADPAAGPLDRQAAAEREAQLYDAFPAEPAGHPELEAHEAELEEPEAG